MNDDLYKLYVLSEIKYCKDNKNVDENLLFPDNWHLIKDYKVMIEIIGEALTKGCLIKDTIGYMNIQEGVKLKKEF